MKLYLRSNGLDFRITAVALGRIVGMELCLLFDLIDRFGCFLCHLSGDSLHILEGSLVKVEGNP
jgi:hypothetical protein